MARKEQENRCLHGRETLGTEFLDRIGHESKVNANLYPIESERKRLIGR
jgi:hypothetical protein